MKVSKMRPKRHSPKTSATELFRAGGFTPELREEILNSIFDEAEKIQGYVTSDTVYHYTDARGFMGVIESNCIWSSNGRYQNDAREVLHGLEIFLSESKKLASDQLPPAFDEILSGLNEKLQEPLIIPYLTCFARDSDQLSQWRGYGDRGCGYAIGFDTINLISRLNVQGYPLNVNYDEQNQREVAITILKQYWHILSSKHDEKWIKSYREQITNFLYMISSIYASSFKNKGFIEEQEFRYVVFIEKQYDTSISFRERNGLIIPFLPLKLAKEPVLKAERHEANPQPAGLFPIKKITIGPCLDSDLSIESVKMLLKQKDYKIEEIKIEKSGIPFLP